MFNLKTLTCLALTIGAWPSFANACCPQSPICNPWYLSVGVGESSSKKANIHVDNRVWDIAQEGYDSDLGDSAIWSAGLGRDFRFLRLDVTASHRGDYDYSKFQTGASPTPGFTGDQRTRKFKLCSNSIMFSAWLDGNKVSRCLAWGNRCFLAYPFMGGGIGVDYLTVTDFHTVGVPFVDSAGNVRDDIPSVNHFTNGSDFVWHAAAGIALNFCPRFTVEAGYNYFHGGDITFPSYIGGTTSNSRRFAGVPAWSGRLAANEFFVEAQVRL